MIRDIPLQNLIFPSRLDDPLQSVVKQGLTFPTTTKNQTILGPDFAYCLTRPHPTRTPNPIQPRCSPTRPDFCTPDCLNPDSQLWGGQEGLKTPSRLAHSRVGLGVWVREFGLRVVGFLNAQLSLQIGPNV